MPGPRPRVLTVAGSDSGGGAGIQADLKVFAVHGVYGLSAITALTAQNTQGVSGILPVTPEFLDLEIAAVLDDIGADAAKTGMLHNAGLIEVTAARLKGASFPLIVDPVCVSGTGHPLLESGAVLALIRQILPLALCLTPNLPEAELLTGRVIDSLPDAFEAGARLLDMGPRAVLLKGGHGYWQKDRDRVTDILFRPGEEPLCLAVPRVATKNTHGTGCALSAAIAANLALGRELVEAAGAAQAYLNRCLAAGFDLGRGAGPPDHLAGLGRGSWVM